MNKQNSYRRRRTHSTGSTTILLFVIVGFCVVCFVISFHRLSLVTSAEGSETSARYPSLRSPLPQIPKSKAKRCSNRTVGDELFKSQSKEDRKLMEWYSGLCEGTYLEMGGLNGVRFSNTYAFHHGLDWKGVLVEASPDSFAKLRVNRPDEIATINAAACGGNQDLHYVINSRMPAVNGFLEFSSEKFRTQYWTSGMIENALVVKCSGLNDILFQALGKDTAFFDFWSLDIEGAEYTALKTLDFEAYQFGVILVERDFSDQLRDLAIETLIQSKGYNFIGVDKRSSWFVHEHFHEIYDGVL